MVEFNSDLLIMTADVSSQSLDWDTTVSIKYMLIETSFKEGIHWSTLEHAWLCLVHMTQKS